jgi:hypothetical protein
MIYHLSGLSQQQHTLFNNHLSPFNSILSFTNLSIATFVHVHLHNIMKVWKSSSKVLETLLLFIIKRIYDGTEIVAIDRDIHLRLLNNLFYKFYNN